MDIWIILIFGGLIVGVLVGTYARKRKASWIKPIAYISIGFCAAILLRMVAELVF